MSKGVTRLVDMVVEEVSLVDRAANKQRFLLVKRDNMEDEENKDETNPPVGQEAPVDEAKAADPQPPADSAADPAADPALDPSASGEGDSPVMETAVAALEALTNLVEAMGEGADTEESKAKLVDIASNLASIAQSVLAEVAPAADPSADPAAPDQAKSEDRTGELLDTAKSLVEKFGKSINASLTQKDATLQKSVDELNAKITKYSELLTEIHQRVSKVEKNVGEPSSAPAEPISKSAHADTFAWPNDLNAKTRESA